MKLLAEKLGAVVPIPADIWDESVDRERAAIRAEREKIILGQPDTANFQTVTLAQRSAEPTPSPRMKFAVTPLSARSMPPQIGARPKSFDFLVKPKDVI